MSKTSTCIVGIGNTLRSDDGAGSYVCSLLEKYNLPISIINTQQLDIAMADELAAFDTVVFVDAALNEKGFSFEALAATGSQPQSFTHHINAAMLASLSQQLFSASTQFYVCAIGSTNFEFGNELSENAKHNANNAATFISEWIASSIINPNS